MKASKTIRTPSVFLILTLALLAATCIPLFVSVFLWRFEYAGNSNRALGLAQIRISLDGATELLRIHSPKPGIEVDPATMAALRLYLNGPVSKIRIGASSASDAAAAIGNLLPHAGLRFSDSGIFDPAGAARGERSPDGTWLLSDPELVREAGAVWDRLPEENHRALANQRAPIFMIRDSSRAVLKVGSTGYIWALSATADYSAPCFEVFHPQIESVDVSALPNARGELVGPEIATLRGRLAAGHIDGVVRYDYYWKNPEDRAERKKVTLLRYLPDWNIVLCAGLYEDEYYLPARAAESMFILLVAFIGSFSIGASFFFASKVSSALKALARYSRSIAAAAGAGHSPPRTGLRELDALGSSMRHMETRIVERESALKDELVQKTALVEEVHHRVKNNLAVLAGIVRLQRDGSLGEESDRLLGLLLERINSIALVYQQLIGDNEFADIPFDDYINGILSYYQSSQYEESRRLIREVRLDPIRVDLGAAVPLGLIVNELISNAYRHGLPRDRDPSISVEFSKDASGLLFRIGDNGDGLPPSCRERLGLTLVRALCSQLRGTMEIRSASGENPGTIVSVRIPG